MTTYENLDRFIMNKMGGFPQPLAGVYCRDVRDECGRIAELTGRESFRICDGRIQALRKAGKIRRVQKGWIRAEPPQRTKEIA